MMDYHESSAAIARDIIGGWLQTDRSHFIVVPPLNRSAAVFEFLRHPERLEEFAGIDRGKLATAFCPHGLARTADALVSVACEGWGVVPTAGRSYRRQLQEAVTKVIDDGRTPILLLPGFHRIVLDLPEELGSVLRDMNQHSGLLCVAEIPLNWITIVERWRNEGRGGLISSGFGQGYRHQLLMGYASSEVKGMLASYALPAGYLGPMMELTGGFHFWIGALLDEARGGRKPPVWIKTLVASVEFAEFLTYLDATGASANRAAIARLFHGIATFEDRAALEGHDWADLLLGEDGALVSSAIGIGCAKRIELHSSQDFENAVLRLIRSGSYKAAYEVIERGDHQEGRLRTAWLVAHILDWVNSGDDEWARVVRALNELEARVPPDASSTIVKSWRDFANKMLSCSKAQAQGGSPDIVGYLCGNGGAEPDPVTALRLIATRLRWAERLSSPYLTTIAILAVPEALVQLYSANKLGLHYWDCPPLDAELLSEIRKLPQREDFQWPTTGGPLTMGQLIPIGWAYMNKLRLADDSRLASNFVDLDRIQQFYTIYRNPLAHRLTTVKESHALRYTAQCRTLLSRVAAILAPECPLEELLLPDLDNVLETMSLARVTGAVQPRTGDTLTDEVGRILDLEHLVITRSILGGLSGSKVYVTEFKDRSAAPMQIGVLKITENIEDFDRECEGVEKARACWLGKYIAPQLRSRKERGKGYIVSPLAFPATKERRVDSLHDLIAAGDRGGSRSIARAIGTIYGDHLNGLVADAKMRSGTPQQHITRVWEPWQKNTAAFDWKKWGFPAHDERSFADGKRNWVNPLACLGDGECWKDDSVISLAWSWQHRDLNTRNVLVGPNCSSSEREPHELKLIDLEKVSESSALLDPIWLSLWMLVAGAEREPEIREQTWEAIPDLFVEHSLGMLKGAPREDIHFDCGVFQLSMDCIKDLFCTARPRVTSVADPIIVHDMAAITLAGAGLAKAYYELRDLQRESRAEELSYGSRWQKARCFFRIASRALESFVVRSRGPYVTDLSYRPT